MAKPPLPPGAPDSGSVPNLLLTFARDNKAAFIKKAVKSGADVNWANEIGQTATHVAAIHGSLQALEALLGAKANPNCQNERGAAPLHFAASAKKNAKQCCELLIANGADITLRDCYGRMPYETVEDRVLRTLLGGAPLDLHVAAREGHLADIKKHIAAGAGAGVDAGAVLLCARGHARCASAAAAAILKEKEAFVFFGLGINAKDDAGATPLHVAVDEGQTNAALLLLELGASAADPDAKGFSPLHLAIIREDPVVAVALLNDPSVDVNARTFPPPLPDHEGPPPQASPLHIAVEMRQASIVQALLARGADANLADGNGDTPLHAGLRGEEEEDETQLAVLQMLLKGGASADAGNGQFPSPAHFCAERGRVGALKVLLDAKADPSVRDKRTGFTPLHLAARAGAVSAVEALLGAGADPNAASASGSTPLHLAALNKRAGAVEAILRLAAGRVDAGAKNAMGKTPWQVAKSDEVKELLSSAAAGA